MIIPAVVAVASSADLPLDLTQKAFIALVVAAVAGAIATVLCLAIMRRGKRSKSL